MSKKACAIICALYAAFILTVAILIFALPKPQISERENRMLAPFPELSLHSLSSRSFSEDFSAFCADRLPLREQLLSLNALRDLALGKQETRNVILRRDKGLVKHLEYSDLSPLKKNIDAIRRHSESFSEADPVFFCAPRAIDIFSDLCPSFFSGERCGSVWEKVGECENITDELRRRANCGEYVFYSTDHHWTTLGAFYAYQSLGVSLGYEPYATCDFRRETVTADFLGTTYSASLIPLTKPDEITLFRYENDRDVKVTDRYTKATSGLYDLSALDGISPYRVFLGGNRACADIDGHAEKRLVVVCDSFACSIIPFLARHFDITVVDPRYLSEPLEPLLEKLCTKDCRLLFLFGLETLCQDEFL